LLFAVKYLVFVAKGGNAMKHKLPIFIVFIAVAILLLNNIASAMIFDFVGKDAKKWFDEFTANKLTTMATSGGEASSWKLTADGLTTDDNVGTGHQRIGISADWTDYTLEGKFQYLKFGTYHEAHLYVRWQDAANNYFFRTIKRNNAGNQSFWSIEWLRKVAGTDNEGDITDDVKVIADLKEKTTYGLRGKIEKQVLTVEFFNGKEWLAAGSVTYPGTFTKGGIGVGRSSCQVAWQYIKVNGAGIPADSISVESLGKLATNWGSIKSLR
jgi:hypothetical protein